MNIIELHRIAFASLLGYAHAYGRLYTGFTVDSLVQVTVLYVLK
jgi:hypothetical protein